MLESVPVCLIVGTVLGFLSGLGIAGGSLLILWLTLVLGMDPATARGINLLFFIPSSLTAGYFRWRQGSLRIRKIAPAMLAGCLSAILFSWLGINLDTELLKKLFGVLLITAGIREVLYKSKE